MRKLLVLADDFTGGLDTGAQFAAAGIPTVVTTNPAYCAADHEEDTVLVVDVETRHLLPEKARQIVEQTIRAAIAHGFTDIYKKTDSALRGNLGAAGGVGWHGADAAALDSGVSGNGTDDERWRAAHRRRAGCAERLWKRSV